MCSALPKGRGCTRSADISGSNAGRRPGRSFVGEFISDPSDPAESYLKIHLDWQDWASPALRPRMQVRRGTAHAFKILRCNHAGGRARAHWWTALQTPKRAYRLSIGANEDKAMTMSIRHSPYLGYAGAGPALFTQKEQRDWQQLYHQCEPQNISRKPGAVAAFFHAQRGTRPARAERKKCTRLAISPRLGSIALLYPEGGHIMNTRWQARAGEGAEW